MHTHVHNTIFLHELLGDAHPRLDEAGLEADAGLALYYYNLYTMYSYS